MRKAKLIPLIVLTAALCVGGCGVASNTASVPSEGTYYVSENAKHTTGTNSAKNYYDAAEAEETMADE